MDESWSTHPREISRPSVHRWALGPQFYRISEYKRPAAAYPCAIFTKFSRFEGNSYVGQPLEFRAFPQWVPELCGFNVGVHFLPNFSALAAKLYFGCENVLEVQEWSSMATRSMVAVRLRAPLGDEKLDVFRSVTLLNGRVCPDDFAIKAIEYENAYDTFA